MRYHGKVHTKMRSLFTFINHSVALHAAPLASLCRDSCRFPLSNHNSNNKCVVGAYLLFYLHDSEPSHTIVFSTAYVHSRDIRIFVLFICFYFEDLACFIGCVRSHTSFMWTLHFFLSPSLQFSNINNVCFKDIFFFRNFVEKNWLCS